MIKVFIAGKYDDTDIISVLDNIVRGQRLAVELMRHGFAPFCPFLDYQYAFHLRPGERLPKIIYQEMSIAFLLVCDAIYMLGNWESSPGARREMVIAMEHDIPVFHTPLDLYNYFNVKIEAES